MYKMCQTEQSIQRQRALEEGLLQLMLKKNYEDISVIDLCNHMNIPRKSFYRYFSSKDGALHALIDHTLAEFFEMPLSQKSERGTAIGDLDLYFAFWYNNKPLLDALKRSSLCGLLVERSSLFALREGHLPQCFKSLPPETKSIAASFSICGLMSMILSWHEGGFQISPDEMSQIAVTILTNPLLPQ